MRGDTDVFRGGIGDGDWPLYPQPISDGKQQVGITPGAPYVGHDFEVPTLQLPAGVAVNGLQSPGDTVNGLQPLGDEAVNGL